MFIFRVCVGAGGDGVGSSESRCSESMGATPPRLFGAHFRGIRRASVLTARYRRGEPALQGDLLHPWRTARPKRCASAKHRLACGAASHRTTKTAARTPNASCKKVASKQLISPLHEDGRQVARPAASFHRPKRARKRTRRAHARAPMKPREWTSRRTAKRHRRDAGSPSSRRRAPRHRASASSPSRTPGAVKMSTPASTSCKDGRTTS